MIFIKILGKAADSIAAHLGLGTVGIEHPHFYIRNLRGAYQNQPVRTNAKMPVADLNRKFLWIKLIGEPHTISENAGIREIEFESFQPPPDNRFWVDAHGNPGTDGFMSVGSIRFEALDSVPDDPAPGTAYFDNLSRKLRVWDGSTWQNAW